MGASLPEGAVRDNGVCDDVEYVVESMRAGERRTWLAMRVGSPIANRCAGMGIAVAPGARVGVEAASLRPLGVIELARSPGHPAGFNPYFDLPAN